MPQPNWHQDLDFEIHVDPSCENEPAGEKLTTMEHEDVIGAQEAIHEEQGSPASAGQDDTITNTQETEQSVEEMEAHDTPAQDLQSTVEEVADDPEDDSVLDSNVWVEEDGPESRRESTSSNTEDCNGTIEGRPSMRTEALIHAAAKEIVEAVANCPRDSIQSAASAAQEEETSFVTESYTESHRQSLGAGSEACQSHVSEEHHAGHTALADEGGDSSSHHEQEDDVFSDNSPRSSMGSMSEAERESIKKISPQKTRTARISDIPLSDADEDFIPTIRGTQRPTFRSPSSVMAMQMSSPPASATATPRSSRRTPRSTVSRLGSPSVSTQYSPKKTPPRFKRNTPPLVLLHVTVLPSRWAWGHVLDNAQPSELSPQGKALWESWNQLQDRTGDTISDRGILLPHPQNDYEVLEERLLETLELPLRRRARILECGHYLGPSNEMSLPDEMESEDEEYYNEHRSPRQSMTEQTYWCNTCSSQIRYDSLGDGKVYRVKVYASNGLMRAGAWEACWKEMERVDVELEPIIGAKLQEELNSLAAEQERALEMEEEAAAAAAAAEAAAVDEEIQRREELEAAEQSYMPEHMDTSVHMEEPSQPEIPVASYDMNDCRMRDEERLREVYGSSPPPEQQSSSIPQPRQSDFVPQQTPASPSVEALGRREERRESQQQTDASASLPELILEAVKVLMQDQRNVLIGLLSLVVLMLALRSGSKSTEAGLKSVIPEPVAQVALEKPVEPISGLVNAPKVETEQEPAREAIRVQNEPKVETLESIAASSMEQVAETSSEAVPMSTIEITKTVTRAMTETRTETMVETITATQFETITEVTANTITETIAETMTETMVETVTVEVLPTEMPKNVPNGREPEVDEVVEEELVPGQVSVEDEDGSGEEL